MRTNEMCQLKLSDIKKINNIWFLHIEDSEETRVKTESTNRKVPLHLQLIDLGFIDYATSLKKNKKSRVFLELSKDRDGFASHVMYQDITIKDFYHLLEFGKNTPKSSIAQDKLSSTNSTLKRLMTML